MIYAVIKDRTEEQVCLLVEVEVKYKEIADSQVVVDTMFFIKLRSVLLAVQ